MTEAPCRVLVVGDALLDVTAAPTSRPHPGGDVPAAIRIRPGGQGANVAVRLARRGHDVQLACALGRDAAGRIVREQLAAERIGVQPGRADETGAVVIVLAPDGERTMLSRRVPLLPMATEAADWTIVSGYVLLEDGDLRLAAGGRIAVLGCAVPDRASAIWWSRVIRLGPDLVILNAREAAAIGRDAATASEEASATVVVTTIGGADAVSPDGLSVSVRVPPVQARDTTGAGDAFAAALIAVLCRRPWPPDTAGLEAALAQGADLGTLVAGVEGAQGLVAGEKEP